MLFRGFLRILENRRSIPVERPGIPRWTTPIKSAIASKGAAIGSCCSAHAAIARRITSETETCLRRAMRSIRSIRFDLSKCRDLSPISVEPNVACNIGLSRCFADLVFPAAATSKRSFHARRRDSCG